MLIQVQTPENPVVFHMDIEDIDKNGYDVYLAAHKVWGELGWNTLEVTHKGEHIANMINSSTMTPTIEVQE